MSLGSRIAKRARVADFASLASTPREPLSFLYPPWLRNSSTASSTPARARRDAPSEPDAQAFKSKPPIPDYPATVGDDPAALFQRFDRPKGNVSRDSPLMVQQLTPKERPPYIATDDCIAALKKERNTHQKDLSTDGTGTASSTRNVVQKVISLQQNKEIAKLSAKYSRKTYQEYKRESKATRIPDWRIILEDLVKHTPQQGKWLSNALIFEIPPNFAPRIMHGIDDYYQEIGDKYGCQMQLAGRSDTTHEFTRFVISGPATAISKCTADILRITPDVKIYATPKGLTDQADNSMDADTKQSNFRVYKNEAEMRYVMARRKESRLQVLPEHIPRPKQWTQLSFLNYVQALTKSHVPSHFRRFGLGLPDVHSEVVLRLLRELFREPEMRSAITRQACHLALGYFVRHNRILDARVMFVRMEVMKMQMVPETFNIMLSGAAKLNDIHNFHFILYLMLHRGIEPNGQTWILFMKAFDDVNIKMHILAAMKNKGLLNHPDVRLNVIQELAHPEIESSLDRNQSQAEFIAHMDSRYGDNWLTASTANHIMRSLGAHGLISRCWELLHLMDSRSVVSDKNSIDRILVYCKQSTNLTGAVELLRSLPKNNMWVPNQETYRIMFDLAWRAHSYNVAKVVWRYACLSAATTLRMRHRVFQSMIESNGVEKPKTLKARWKKYAGPVITGLNDLSEHPSRAPDHAFIFQVTEGKEAILSDYAETRMDRFPDEEPALSSGHEGNVTEGSAESVSEDSTDVQGDAVTTPDMLGLAPADPPQDAESTDTDVSYYRPLECHNLPSWTQHLENRKLPQILEPWGPSRIGKRLPQYKVPILKEYFYADLGMHKEWEPVRPFHEILVSALRMDDEWKSRNGNEHAEREGEGKKEKAYKEWGLEELLDGRALKVRIRMKGVRGGQVFYDWR
ncbi:uncharacterized protein L3040_001277 [Drepanopeziza brunnea f. sp. 'multigermtubi']|uniref:Pentatricopeptide repeat domain-containing protein n=1 Tax=Marssonina brunnea f. sp. multigermtubi (strain MB_m1) TaxID=1072389 RepID=K1X7A4_MARBU|nr:pentatricopeptide repeat domain-containing protein [Drepanopeziza brunnea f. sp. 'multigermtubi' MB_m1]EKD16538.1 pentatricopeptide repeat domain-containing protein [Drepanopeziza brunnea f. sp. 'multigermtubi' MB_m1]KAJ5051501.1 hypothetical protein L3040_001277 [Drepanopeziza brunnea f. sp. 'multigermtubi']